MCTRWLTRTKFTSTDDNVLRKFFTLKSANAKLPPMHAFNAIDKSKDAEAVKAFDPRLRDTINQLLTKLNSRQKASTGSLANNGASRSVQSFYPKCKLFLIFVLASCFFLVCFVVYLKTLCPDSG